MHNKYLMCMLMCMFFLHLTLQVKGNVFKNKRVLIEAVHKQKAEKIREKAIADQFEARRAKNKATRERKAQRREERLSSVSVQCAGVHGVLSSSRPYHYVSEM